MIIEQQLQDIEDRELIYPDKGCIVIDTRVNDYPDVDSSFLATLLDDYMFNWHDAKTEYLETAGSAE